MTKRKECLIFFVVLSTSWYIFTLIISYTWTERDFKLIISVFFPDNYSCSIERVLEQYRWCESSLFNYFKGFSMRMDLFGDDQNFKKGGIRYQTHYGTSLTPFDGRDSPGIPVTYTFSWWKIYRHNSLPNSP